MRSINYPTYSKAQSRTVLQRIAEGDKSAVENCIDIYGGIIWSLAKKHTASPAEAEAVTLEIFNDIWKYADCFDPNKFEEADFVDLIACRRLSKK